MKRFYRIVAPWNNYKKTIAEFNTKDEARKYVAKNSIHVIPFDPNFLTIETRVK